MEIAETFKPDIYQVLGDGDTNADSSKKRLHNSTDRTEQFFIACLERHKKSEALKNSMMMATISGGYNLLWREKSAMFYKEYEQDVDGFVVDGLHCNGVEASMLNRAAVQEVVGHTLKLLPCDKMKVMLGAYNPLMVLEMIKLGIDVFDSSYVYLCSMQNRALTFSFDVAEAIDLSNYHLDVSDVK
jgi:queuine tRNA-ribosyltransferase accessory subunit